MYLFNCSTACSFAVFASLSVAFSEVLQPNLVVRLVFELLETEGDILLNGSIQGFFFRLREVVFIGLSQGKHDVGGIFLGELEG